MADQHERPRSDEKQEAADPDEDIASQNPATKTEDPDPPESCQDGSESRGPARRHPGIPAGGLVGLAVGALGVVFGDIGTSPLYALQTVYSLDGHAIKPTEGDTFGVISVVFWSITLVVSVKYVAFILRADNDGEGGVMALAALARRYTSGNRKLVAAALLLGVAGASLFYGDSVITPAISVLSAVEGLKVVSPDFKDAVLPLAAVVLALLFLVQRFGTHLVGRLFGPVMVVWFAVVAVLGVHGIVQYPRILRALSPVYIGTFVADHPYLTFIALGAVVLSITGAEALYADMGHFGRRPIRLAWFLVAFPCLVLNYLGQGALVLADPRSVSNPFFLLGPSWARIPMVVLATLATVIASQAVISGAYSMTRQAARLGFLPNLTIRHTSKKESGQIYLPAVNWLLFGSVLVLMLAFRSSARLADAYGLAVTGTFLITTTLFVISAATAWHWPRWKLIGVATLFGVVELAYFAANVVKIPHGGWLPLLIAVLVVTVMTTWQAGRRIVTARRRDLEGSLQDFVDELRGKQLVRVPGIAVFPHPSKDTTPLALRANVEYNHVLHEHVVLVSVRSENIPYVQASDRVEIDNLEDTEDGVVHVSVRFGFQEEQHIPKALAALSNSGLELDFDASEARYYLSRLTLMRGDEPGLATWRKRLFIGLAHNAANPADAFRLPDERTIVMGAHLEL